jgi:hypothetical protein
MRLIARLTAVCLVGVVTFGSIVYAAEAPTVPQNPSKTEASEDARNLKRQESAPLIFRHGDISWLPELAAQAGWPQRTWKRLGQIILRESGGCPNRAGGDAVDRNCTVTHVTEWTHRSDTGLLQITGVNYDPTRNRWAVICNKMQICEQPPLFDPLTNLKAGFLLWEVAGWDPWRRS